MWWFFVLFCFFLKAHFLQNQSNLTSREIGSAHVIALVKYFPTSQNESEYREHHLGVPRNPIWASSKRCMLFGKNKKPQSRSCFWRAAMSFCYQQVSYGNKMWSRLTPHPLPRDNQPVPAQGVWGTRSWWGDKELSSIWTRNMIAHRCIKSLIENQGSVSETASR